MSETINIKEIIEEKIGAVTSEELEFAIEQFEKNCKVAGTKRKLYDSTAYDMLVTNIDFFRRKKAEDKI